ncbi:CHAP domain-containing protein [Bacillus subtilis]|uniref:CHAP domain-containing protein n=1 Tax=Bacillus subtilis TaxID=1423 RepID=UPI00100A1B58|nr:CHAP domain-containing protein [Bacillus subtilis]QAV89574.1 CHAP domain-containing protein [Bacillus subtilis]
MAETNEKIHVLADETLGGIKREYVEVDRKAEVGERIIIVKADCQSEYRNGDMAFVSRFVKDDSRLGYYAESILANGQLVALYDREYHVLEPTDIVRIGGQRYEMDNDNARKGDMVIVTASYDYAVGHVDTVKEVDSDYVDGSVYLVEGENGETYLDGTEEDYRVLVPIESTEADEPQPVDAVFAIGNVAQEVAKLKRTVERLENEIDTLHKDNLTLGEELARLKESVTGVKGEKLFTADELAAIIERLLMRP